MKWIKNNGQSAKAPTNKRVHIRLSKIDDNHPNGIWFNQDPHKWDWLHQSCEIVEYAIASEVNFKLKK